jgi:Na+/H+-translocating membrane pyrophosphatase
MEKGNSFAANDGFAIGSIVFGVLSLFAWYLSPWKSVGIVLSVMGLGYGIIARHTQLHRLAIAGALVSGIGLLANLMSSGLLSFLWQAILQ